MGFQLEAETPAGREFVALCQAHAPDFEARAAAHDRDGTFPFENVDDMKASGVIRATVPEEFGGLGVTSLRDMAIGLNRIGRADGSTAIALNMHLSTCWTAARLLRGEREQAQETGLRDFVALLGGGLVVTVNLTEPGTDTLHPLTEVTRTEGGWLLNGRKSFGTLSPVADLFLVGCRCRADGRDVRAFAFALRNAPGVTVRENWDAMGMRASGSHDIVYENCFVPDAQVRISDSPWGQQDGESFIIGSGGTIGLVAAFLGIAERSFELAVDMVRTRIKTPDEGPLAERTSTQHVAAGNEVDLAVCRALIDRVGRLLDAALVNRPVADDDALELMQLFTEFQAAKYVVNRKAIDVVDRSLTLSGGAGYLSTSPLARLYRDVRAGPFMQPFSPTEAPGYIGKVALGIYSGGYE
ncbi:MAG: acyl-CoA dehydrogenase family protein [Acidimicrobiia bacterium]